MAQMTNSPPIRVGIYGSCVSRDTFRILEPEGYALKLYVARHSVISMDTDARGRYPADLEVESPFQRTQIETDAAGAMWGRIQRVTKKLDVLLWDLVDERHGCVRFSDGTYVTRSVDMLSRPSLAKLLEAGELLSFGSDRHFFTWQLAADRFVERLREVGLLERTLLVAVPWAESLVDGSPAPTSMGVKASAANAAYARYYAHLHSLGVSSVTSENPRGDAQHVWGAAPFHYERSVYEDIHAGLSKFVEARRVGGSGQC